jgi:hypothetical protein
MCESLQLVIDTAWVPPFRWFNLMVTEHADLDFHLYYAEPGMGNFGDFYTKGGVITEVEHRDYETLSTDDHVWLGNPLCESCDCYYMSDPDGEDICTHCGAEGGK